MQNKKVDFFFLYPNAQLNPPHVTGSCSIMKAAAKTNQQIKSWARYSKQTPVTVVLQKFFNAAEPPGISERRERERKNDCEKKILPSHPRVTKQATWEPEPWEYRAFDSGNIRQECLFCVYVRKKKQKPSAATICLAVVCLKIHDYDSSAFPCGETLICASHVRGGKAEPNLQSGICHLWEGRWGAAQPGGRVTHSHQTIQLLFWGR